MFGGFGAVGDHTKQLDEGRHRLPVELLEIARLSWSIEASRRAITLLIRCIVSVLVGAVPYPKTCASRAKLVLLD